MKVQRISLYLLGAALVLAPPLYVILDGCTDHVEYTDVALVLGTKVHPNGVPSRRLKARLDRALQLYREGWIPKILVSGGVGREGHDEAQVMRDYLVDHGVPAEAVILDSEGVDTFHSARTTARYLKRHDLTRVLVVTQYFHVTRSRLALKRFGVPSVFTAPARLVTLRDPYAIAREIAALLFYALRPYPSPRSCPIGIQRGYRLSRIAYFVIRPDTQHEIRNTPLPLAIGCERAQRNVPPRCRSAASADAALFAARSPSPNVQLRASSRRVRQRALRAWMPR